MARRRTRAHGNKAGRAAVFVAIAFAAIIIASAFGTVSVVREGTANLYGVLITRGQTTFYLFRGGGAAGEAEPSTHLYFSWHNPGVSLGYDYQRRGFKPGSHPITVLSIPLWPAVLLAGTVAAGLVLRSHRLSGTCGSCRYDLSGLPPGSPCPECAAKPPPNPCHRGPHP